LKSRVGICHRHFARLPVSLVMRAGHTCGKNLGKLYRNGAALLSGGAVSGILLFTALPRS
jgi:hypothetical protein